MLAKKRNLATPSEMGSKRLCTMWADRSFADLEVSCAGHTWTVHQAVLAAGSPVFKRMLTSDFVEGQKKCIDIKDADKACVDSMLKFLYTGSITDVDPGNLPCNSAAAHRQYHITGITGAQKNRCGTFELLDHETDYGHPVWKKSNADMWICSSSDTAAQWQITNCRGSLGLVGVALSAQPHGGRLPCKIDKASLKFTLACASCEEAVVPSAQILKGVLALATLYDIKDLVHICITIMIDNGMVNKDNIVMVARALRDAGPGDDSQELLSELHCTTLKDKGIFMAMVQHL